MYHAWRWRSGPTLMTALGALDIALWDLEGKRLGVPVYRLLGRSLSHAAARLCEPLAGRRDHARASLRWRTRGAAARLYGIQMEPFRRGHAAQQRGQGDRACHRADGGGARGRWPRDQDLRRVRRAAVSAQRGARGAGFLPYRPGWFEEPIPFENAKAMVQLQRELPVPIATGERLLSRWEVRALLEDGGCKVLQPDVMHAGGITEVKRIAALADMYYIPIARTTRRPDLHAGGHASSGCDPELPHS